jgi:hypothetical protein
MVCSKSLEMLGNELASTNTNNINNSDAVISNQYKAVEGGPLDGIQCGEKMWVIFDTQSPPYFDVQFLVTGKFISLHFYLFLIIKKSIQKGF